MSAEAKTINDAIFNVFESDSILDYLTFYQFEDELTIQEKGIYPFCNIDIDTFRITNADNMNPLNMERRIYPVKMLYGNRHRVKSCIKNGDGLFKSIFDIWDDLYSVILKDRTFGGAVKKVPYRPDFASDIMRHQDGSYWIGIGMAIIEVYKDVYLI